MRPALIALSPFLSLALSACVTAQPPSDGLAYAALGETVYVDGPKVTPIAVIEDSRCPADVQCVWAGRVRISARIHLGTGDTTQELTLGEPIPVADGSLELRTVQPPKTTEAAIPPGDYRFGFNFMGGL
ncbi:MAG: hypothetical protein KDE55_09515 [Novosphingobium sp.]|nr:hypothetical protein [Novosphingobium sp.]